MESSFTTIEIILLIGAVQGFVLAFVLFTSKKAKALPNRLLSILLIIFSLNIIIHTVSHGNHPWHIPHHETIITLLFFLVGPLLYLYAKLLTITPQHINRKDLLHFLPFVIFLIISFPLYIVSINMDKPVAFLLIIMDSVIVHIILYMILSIMLLRKHALKIKQSFSSIERINLNWLRFLISGLAVLWISALLTDLIPAMRKNWDYQWLFISIFMYVIGYIGLKQPMIFSGEFAVDTLDDKMPKKKYEKSTLTKEMAEKYLQKLKTYIENERPYLKNDLTLPELSDKLSIPVHYLSQIINEQFNQNFFEFINSYRIEEAKKLIRHPDKQNLNLASIAFESGFNSVSSFNSAFKKFAGITPSQYRSNQNL